MNLKSKIRTYIYKKWPSIREKWIMWNWILGKDKVGFAGWGLVSVTYPPWQVTDGKDKTAMDFIEVNEKFHKKVNNKDINLIILKNNIESLDYLTWRHFIVFWSVKYAMNFTNIKEKNLVEAGTADGITAYFAMSSAKIETANFKMYLYDAWDSMDGSLLTESEKVREGHYGNLSINNTKGNLKEFSNFTTFNKGYIPEVFAKADNPEKVVWIHIDLNSSFPTEATLEFFYSKLASGGVILFDDYAFRKFRETKIVVDKFFNDKKGLLQHLATGQAIFYKSSVDA